MVTRTVQRKVARHCRTALAMLILLAALGCAQQQWSKPGLNQSDFDRDAAKCRRESEKATFLDPFDAGSGQDFDRSAARQKLFEQCMFSKGYRLERKASESNRD